MTHVSARVVLDKRAAQWRPAARRSSSPHTETRVTDHSSWWWQEEGLRGLAGLIPALCAAGAAEE